MPVDFSAALRLVRQWVEQGFYPGASLIVGRGAQVLVAQSFGNHGPERVEYIASAGKWLAAAAIATVVDEERLSWDARVVDWLPEFAGDAGAVTLRQLLSHTSGFAPQQPEGRRNDDYQTLEESVAQISKLALLERPGTRFRYGGLAMQVAGRMAELATGQSFEELFQARIARPLGLEQTHFTPVDPSPGHNPMIGGGARSCARDYARFLAMIAAGGHWGEKRILSSLAIAELEGDQVGAAQLEPGEFVERVRGSTHKGVYGLGLWRERVDAQGRAMLISSPSWAGTYPWIDRQRGVYGVLVAHVDLQGPPWEGGFNPFYSSAALADLVGAALDRAEGGA
jgi:CubicO group peptidase (beta-lactamase class C family)